MINVKIKMYGYLKDFAKVDTENDASIVLKNAATVYDLLNEMGLPEDIEIIMTVNKKYFPKNQIMFLQDQDYVEFFPTMTGG